MNGCCYGREWDAPCAVRFPYYSDAYIEQVGTGQIKPPVPLFSHDLAAVST